MNFDSSSSFDSLSAGLSRRGVLKGAGIGASALMLAACSSGGDAKPTPAKDLSAKQKSLRFDSRDTYRNTVGEDFPLLEQFTAASGIAVTYTNAVSDDNVYYSKVKDQLKMGQDIGADASVLSEWMAARWIRLGYVQPFDLDSIPNLEHIRSRFARAASMRDTLGLIMLANGVDIESADWGDAEFTAAVEMLRNQVKSRQLLSIKGNKYKEDLKSGATIATIARAGDIMQINAEAGDKWGFAIPEKGGVLWSDVVVMPTGSSHRSNAEEFINFYYDPANAVQVAAATNFISPVDIRQLEIDVLDESVASNRMVFPSTVTFETVRAFRTLSQSEEQRYGSQYQTVLLSSS